MYISCLEVSGPKNVNSIGPKCNDILRKYTMQPAPLPSRPHSDLRFSLSTLTDESAEEVRY